jgi:hypothetical protein
MINFNSSLRATAKQSSAVSHKKWIAASAFGLLAMTVLITSPSFAADEPSKDEPAAEAQEEAQEEAAEDATGPYTYSPENCEFTATFPSPPEIKNRCEARNGKNLCYDEVSFTQVFDLSSTVKFNIICNEVDEALRETYSGEIMEATLAAMTKNTVVETYDTSFREEKDFKQAGLVGEGKVGKFSTLYIAQLWIGASSAMSVEAEMIGEASEEADTLFSTVLKSVNFDNGKKAKTAE